MRERGEEVRESRSRMAGVREGLEAGVAALDISTQVRAMVPAWHGMARLQVCHDAMARGLSCCPAMCRCHEVGFKWSICFQRHS